MFRSVGMPDNFNMIIPPVKKFLYINGFGGIQDRFDSIIPLALRWDLNIEFSYLF